MRKPYLSAIAAGLRLEAAFLSHRPDAIFQQLHNRLQWQGTNLKALLRASLQSTGSGHAPRANGLLPPREASTLVTVLEAHSGPVWGCDVSPDGSWAVTTSDDESLALWDLDNYQLRSRHYLDSGPLGGCCISSDATQIAVGSTKGLRIVRSDDASIVFSEKSPPNGFGDDDSSSRNTIAACSFSPDLAYVVEACGDGSIRVLDLPSGSVRYEVAGHQGRAFGCAIAPDSSLIVSAGQDGFLRAWDAQAGTLITEVSAHRGSAFDCAVTPDGTQVLSSGEDGLLRLWGLPRLRQVGVLEGHDSGVFRCCIAADGSVAVSASADLSVRIWDLRSLRLQKVLYAGSGFIYCCALTPDASVALSGGAETTLRAWNTAVASDVDPLGHRRGISDCCTTLDGAVFITAGAADRTLRVWEMETGKELRTLTGHQRLVAGVDAFSDVPIAASSSWDGTVRIWDVVTGTQRGVCQVPPPVYSCALVRHGPRVMFTTGSELVVCQLRLGRTVTVRVEHRLPHEDRLVACSASLDGTLTVTSDAEGALTLWDLRRYRRIRSWRGHGGQANCVLSPDGAFVGSIGVDGAAIHIWDTVSGVGFRLPGHKSGVLNLAISPDGRLIASAGFDRTVSVWSVSMLELAGSEILAVGLSTEPRCICFHPTEPKIIVGDGAGGLHMFDLVDVEYGPLLVVPVKDRWRMKGSCPHCAESFRVHNGDLGRLVSCPRPSCNKDFRVTLVPISQKWMPGPVV